MTIIIVVSARGVVAVVDMREGKKGLDMMRDRGIERFHDEWNWDSYANSELLCQRQTETRWAPMKAGAQRSAFV